jgi:hypothetical protein
MEGFLQDSIFKRHHLGAVAMSLKMTLAQFTWLNVAMSFVNARRPWHKELAYQNHDKTPD